MYKKLIDEKFESYNPDGIRFDDEVLKALEPILEKYIDEGFSSTEIELIAINTIQLKLIGLRAVRAIQLKKKGMKNEITNNHNK